MGLLCGLAAGVIKYLMFAANVLFMLSGIAILVMGIIIQNGFQAFDKLLNGSFSGTAIAIIVIGCLIIIIGFCGCCGAIRKSVCLLNIYSVMLLGVFIAEIAIGIVALQQVGTTQEFMKDNFKAFFEDEYKTPSSTLFDKIHKKFKCCAVDGPDDFASLTPPVTVPDSCKGCSPLDMDICDANGTFKNGCTTKFSSWLEEGVRSVGIICLSVAACEVVAIVFACCLATRFKKKAAGN